MHLLASGFWCASGVDTPTPSGSNTGNGSFCPVGHFCAGGNALPQPCPAGTFQNSTTQADCRDCPAGYYCVQESSDFSHQICPSGYYCPNNTRFDIEYPCMPGTFNNLTGKISFSPTLYL